jgi:putative peptidoglycan lipid II flippase
MLQIMAWGVPLYISSALLMYLEIGSNRFHLATLRPFVQNLGVIIALIIAYLGGQPIWIAWGFTGTYLFFNLYGFLKLIKSGILESGWYHHWHNFRRVAEEFWASMKPMAFFSLIMQINILLEKAIASLIGPGAVAAVDYARLIPDTAQVLIIVPLSLVSLSTMVTLQEIDVKERSDQMIAMVLLLFVPLSGLLAISAHNIIHLIYMRGAFNEDSVFLTSQLLKGMAVGMWAICLSYVLQKVYNARIRNHEVLRIGAIGIFANAVFNLIAYRYIGVLAIGLGFSLGGIIMAWFYIKGMGSLMRTIYTAKICLFAIFPYGILALIIDKAYDWTPLTGLIVQMLWSLLFWGATFWFFPTSRDMLQKLSGKLMSIKLKNSK